MTNTEFEDDLPPVSTGPGTPGPLTPEQQAIQEGIRECEKLISQIYYYDSGRVKRDNISLDDEGIEALDNPLSVPADLQQAYAMDLDYESGDMGYTVSMNDTTQSDIPDWSLIVRKDGGDANKKEMTFFRIYKGAINRPSKVVIKHRVGLGKEVEVPTKPEHIETLKSALQICLNQAIEHGERQKTK